MVEVMYEKIARHIGHNIEVATYGDPIVNVSVECMDCYEVIVDADNPDEPNQFLKWRASKKHPYGVERA